MHKACVRCGKSKPVGSFVQLGSSHRSECKTCRTAYNRARRHGDREFVATWAAQTESLRQSERSVRSEEDRKCLRCEQVKPSSEFSPAKKLPRTACKACCSAYQRARWSNDKAFLVAWNEKTRILSERRANKTDKVCTRCRQLKPIEAFWPDRKYRTAACKSCLGPIHKSAYRRMDRAKLNQQYRDRYRANLDAHRESAVRRSARRRAAKASAVSDLTREQWRGIVDCFDGRCAYCLRKLRKVTVDHVVPLVRGGDDTAGNVVPACDRCNKSKGDRPLWTMVNVPVAC